MKKQIYSIAIAAALLFSACTGGAPSQSTVSSQSASSPSAPQSTVLPLNEAVSRTTFNIASLKGPTTMGAVKLMQDAESGTARHDYKIEMFGSAEEITPKLIKGELDAAIIPCNLASVLYNKTEGEIVVAAVNNLGVLYMISQYDGFNTIADLKGATIYTTGKGTTPEYILNHILKQNGLDPDTDLTIEYKSEASEAAAAFNLSSGYPVVMLPEPYATSFMSQAGDKAKRVFDMNAEWKKVQTNSEIVTGVLVARKSFIEENKAAFAQLLEDYEASIAYAGTNADEAAALIAKYGIVPNETLAKQALPGCSLHFLSGDEMQQAVNGYLSVLFEQNPQSVGGKLPDDGFYYKA